MALEEQTQKHSNSSSGGGGSGATGGGGAGSSGRSGIKLKQKKVPQRGLGVAQLERIRLEEQQKREAASLQTSTLLPVSNSFIFSGNNSCLSNQCTNYLPALSPKLPDAPTTDLPLPNLIRRPHSLEVNGDATHMNSSSNSMSNIDAGGSETGWPGNWPKVWSSEYNLEGGENRKLDCRGLAIQTNISNFPYETKTPAWPLSGLAQRSEQFQHPCLPMVNVPTGTSKSSMQNFQIEPPSNQNYRGNSCTALWPEEEKMVGMKRTFPFAIEDAPGPSLNFRYPHVYASFIPKTDEAASSSNDGVSTIQAANPPILREFLSTSSGRSDPQKKRNSKEAGSFNGDFLTLAPSKIEIPPPYLSPHCQEVPDFDALPYQEVGDDTVKWQEVGRPVQQPFYNFLPPASTQNGKSMGNTNNGNFGEQAEVVDLNLKL